MYGVLTALCMWWFMAVVDSSADQVQFDHRPRLCHVRSWNDGRGFGFNMQAERGKHGQYIGKVESGSAAEAAGLRDGDRIVEVNGSNINHDTHKQVETTSNYNQLYSSEKNLLFSVFTRDSILHVYAIVYKCYGNFVCLSFRPSVRHTRGLYQNG